MLSSTGELVVNVKNTTMQQLVGPTLPLHAWTHIAHTYSTANGFRLYINGTLRSSAVLTVNAHSSEVKI